MNLTNNPYSHGSANWYMHHVLEANPSYRDCDISAYFTAVNLQYNYDVNKKLDSTISLSDVSLSKMINAEKEGKIKKRSSFERAWRHVQKQHPHLRGKDYDKRHAKAKEMAKEYAKS